MAWIETLQWLDAGNGARLYAGHNDRDRQTVWEYDGTSWTPVGDRMQPVRALAVFDPGSGPALFVGGEATDDAGKAAWFDGATWHELDAGGVGAVQDMIVFDDGSGPALYAAGEFDSIGGVAASGVARWDGVGWSAVGAGLSRSDGPAVGYAMEIFDDGSGPALYVAGEFDAAGGSEANHIARWDGSVWTPLGDGLDRWTPNLVVFDNGSGAALYTIPFASFGERLRRWNGSRWDRVGAPVDNFLDVTDMVVHDDGRGPAIFTAGQQRHRFEPDGEYLDGPFRWDGTSWEFWDTIDDGFFHNSHSRALASDGQQSMFVSAKVTDVLQCGGSEIVNGVFRYRCSGDVCRVDLNCDGILDGSDVAFFAQLMQWHESSADFNADGLINFFDVSEYLRAFAAGCS